MRRYLIGALLVLVSSAALAIGLLPPGNPGFIGSPGALACPPGTTTTIITSGTTWTVPQCFNSSNNTVQCLGAGAAGRNTVGFSGGRSGGAGGDYAKSVNITLTPGASVTIQVGTGGAVSTNNPSNSGGDTWFNSASFPASGQACGAKGGAGDDFLGAAAGNTANDYSTGTGALKYAGGGSGAAVGGGTGGGGAAGPSGAGTTSADSLAGSGSTGGKADNNTVTGGAPGNPGAVGSSGTEFDSTHGSGAGGGGGDASAGGAIGGDGGGYGGGGGGAGSDGVSSTKNGGAGAPGLIVVTFTN